MSMSWSFAILRTKGDERCRILVSIVSAGWLECRSSATAGFGLGDGNEAEAPSPWDNSAGGRGPASVAAETGATVGDWAPGFAPDSPVGRMTATTLLTGTVSPSFTRISATVPAAGAGISAST